MAQPSGWSSLDQKRDANPCHIVHDLAKLALFTTTHRFFVEAIRWKAQENWETCSFWLWKASCSFALLKECAFHKQNSKYVGHSSAMKLCHGQFRRGSSGVPSSVQDQKSPRARPSKGYLTLKAASGACRTRLKKWSFEELSYKSQSIYQCQTWKSEAKFWLFFEVRGLPGLPCLWSIDCCVSGWICIEGAPLAIPTNCERKGAPGRPWFLSEQPRTGRLLRNTKSTFGKQVFFKFQEVKALWRKVFLSFSPVFLSFGHPFHSLTLHPPSPLQVLSGPLTAVPATQKGCWNFPNPLGALM